MMNATTKVASNDHKPITVGEELFLVHLLRDRGDETFDHLEQRHKRSSRTVGEELWDIHRKRSRGREDDADEAHAEDDHSSDTSANAALKDKKHDDDFCEKNDGTNQKCRYNLRSKGAAKKI